MLSVEPADASAEMKSPVARTCERSKTKVELADTVSPPRMLLEVEADPPEGTIETFTVAAVPVGLEIINCLTIVVVADGAAYWVT